MTRVIFTVVSVVGRLESLAELIRRTGDGDGSGAHERPIGRNEKPTARVLSATVDAQ